MLKKQWQMGRRIIVGYGMAHFTEQYIKKNLLLARLGHIICLEKDLSKDFYHLKILLVHTA